MAGMSLGLGLAIAGGMGAAGAVASGMMQAGAAEDAANAQVKAAKGSNQLQWDMYQQNRRDMLPWITAGQGAVNRLASGVQPGGEFSKFTLQDFMKDPGYQFRVKEGERAALAGGSASGMLGSGNMKAALTQLGQSLATDEYSNAYARWLDEYNRVASLANMGQQQSQAVGSMGTQVAGIMGNTMVGAANARAAGMIGSANAWGNAIGGVTNQFTSGLGSWLNYNQNQQFLDALQFGQYGAGGMGSFQMGGQNYVGPTTDNPISWGY